MEKILYTELSNEDQELINQAREATHRAYAPYSQFFVGSAVLMADGEIFTGSNQENASYHYVFVQRSFAFCTPNHSGLTCLLILWLLSHAIQKRYCWSLWRLVVRVDRSLLKRSDASLIKSGYCLRPTLSMSLRSAAQMICSPCNLREACLGNEENLGNVENVGQFGTF